MLVTKVVSGMVKVEASLVCPLYLELGKALTLFPHQKEDVLLYQANACKLRSHYAEVTHYNR